MICTYFQGLNPTLGWLKSRFQISVGTINLFWKYNFHEKSWKQLYIGWAMVRNKFRSRLGSFWHPYIPIYRKVAPGRSWTNRKQPADHHVTDHFRKNPYFSEILETIRNTMQKNRLSIPAPSPEKPQAEIHRLRGVPVRINFSSDPKFQSSILSFSLSSQIDRMSHHLMRI